MAIHRRPPSELTANPVTRMASDIPDDPDPDDDLVAYLDGELDGADARSMESKLAFDPKARAEADAFKKTYDLLDYLPKPEPSATFATRTLTQIYPVASDELPATKPPAPSSAGIPFAPSQSVPLPVTPQRTVWVVLGWCSATLLVTMLGYLGHLLARPHLEADSATKQTSEQVRLLERLPMYLGVDDIGYLKSLDDPDLFGDNDGDTPAPAKVTLNGTSETFTSPELAKLENLLKTFPPVRQQQLRQLDEELETIASPVQEHLLSVLERYSVWLDRLPDDYRKEILSAPAAPERLDAVRRVKERTWRKSLPQLLQEKIQAAEGPNRERELIAAKKQDTERRRIWELARRDWANLKNDRKPWPFETDETAKPVQDFVDKQFKSRLKPEEWRDLDESRQDATPTAGYFAWLNYGAKLHRAAESHPSLPESANGKVIRTANDLPVEFVKQINKAVGIGGRRLLLNHPAAGKWPDFAEVVWKEAIELKVPIRFPLGPSKPEDYPSAVKIFCEGPLAEKLDAKDRDELRKLEGNWPDHPRRMIELAKKHDLAVPGVTLPGPPSLWQKTYGNNRPPPKKSP